MKPRIKMVCKECGSDDVLCDAYAVSVWDVDTQQWEVVNTFDKGAYCNECDGETRLEQEEVEVEAA